MRDSLKLPDAPLVPRTGLSTDRLMGIINGQVVSRLIVLVGAVLFLLPLFWMIVTSLKPVTEVAVFPPTVLPQVWKWSNYAEAFRAIPFARYFVNSSIIAVGSTLGAVVSNFLIAYGFSRIQWRGRDTVFMIVLATIFIPFPVTMIPLVVVFSKLHWINTYLPLIVPSFFGNAFFIFLLRQFLMQLPMELSEAARIDGASELQVMRQIILPLAKPALTVVAIFSFINAWNDFLGPLLYLQDERLYTLAIGLQAFRSTHDVQITLLMAASTLAVLPIIVLFLIFQRSFIDGITTGTLK